MGSATLASALTQDVGIVLLINGITTVAALYFLINIGGTDLNPVVTLMKLWDRTISVRTFLATLVAQFLGAIIGTVIANRMYSDSFIGISTSNRYSTGAIIAEVIATFGLLYVVKNRPADAPRLVPGWILVAFFATASTAFANPAVTFGRIFTKSFSGISPTSALSFMGAQLTALIILQLTHSRKM